MGIQGQGAGAGFREPRRAADDAANGQIVERMNDQVVSTCGEDTTVDARISRAGDDTAGLVGESDERTDAQTASAVQVKGVQGAAAGDIGCRSCQNDVVVGETGRGKVNRRCATGDGEGFRGGGQRTDDGTISTHGGEGGASASGRGGYQCILEDAFVQRADAARLANEGRGRGHRDGADVCASGRAKAVTGEGHHTTSTASKAGYGQIGPRSSSGHRHLVEATTRRECAESGEGGKGGVWRDGQAAASECDGPGTKAICDKRAAVIEIEGGSGQHVGDNGWSACDGASSIEAQSALVDVHRRGQDQAVRGGDIQGACAEFVQADQLVGRRCRYRRNISVEVDRRTSGSVEGQGASRGGGVADAADASRADVQNASRGPDDGVKGHKQNRTCC